MNKKNIFIDLSASMLKIGYFPIASGTVASFFSVIIYILFFYFIKKYTDILWLIFGFVLLYISFPIATEAEKLYNEKDSHLIVIDESVGYFFTMMLLPAIDNFNFNSLLIRAGAGFLLFRFFDIVKIYPISQLQKLEGGCGVVMDDVLAGIYANITLKILIYYLHF